MGITVTRSFVIAGAAVFFLFNHSVAFAQVEIGGRGKPPVEVDMDVLNNVSPSGAPPLAQPRPRVDSSPLPLSPSGQVPVRPTGSTGNVPVQIKPRPVKVTPTAKPVVVQPKPAPVVEPKPEPKPEPPPVVEPKPEPKPEPPPVVEPKPEPKPEPPPVIEPPPEPKPEPPPVVEPPPEPTPPPAPVEVPAPAEDGRLRILFPEGVDALSEVAKLQLDALAQAMTEAPNSVIQLKAFASGTEATASKARRTSLSRALAVRAYLMEKGIASTRMQVQARGFQSEEGPADRVDVLPMSR